MTATVHAELRKLLYTRSLWLLLVAGVAISTAATAVLMFAFKAADIPTTLSGHGSLRFGPTNVGLLLVLFGIRVFADETHHHTIGSTFVATPDRLRVLAAKALVAATSAFALCAAIYALVIAVTVAAASARDLSMTMDLAATIALFGRVVLAMTLSSLLGVGLAAAVRNRAIALVGVVVWLALAENIVGTLLRIPGLMPASLMRAVVAGGASGAGALDAPLAALALVAVVAASFAAAVVVLRDDVA
ncbi:MAG TPA: hypothetical protein VF230_05255 [Acidimicrobiales bacterium]